MSKGSPSMIALLGLLAVAGFQNRDKLTGVLQDASDRTDGNRMRLDYPGGRASGGLVENLRGVLQGAGGGGLVAGLTEFLGRFSNPVQSAKAQSWVDTGPNGTLGAADLEEVLDEHTLAELSERTGLHRADLLARLSAVLPGAVDGLTPHGRMPTADEARELI